MIPDTIYIDIKTSELTLSQVMARIVELQAEHPDQEIFMDGDAYAVVGRRRAGGRSKDVRIYLEIEPEVVG